MNLQLVDLNLQNTGLVTEHMTELIEVIHYDINCLKWLNLAENPMTHKPIQKYAEINEKFI